MKDEPNEAAAGRGRLTHPSAFILHPSKAAVSVEPRELVGLWVGEKWTTPQGVKTRFNDSRGSTEVADVCMENVRRGQHCRVQTR